MSHILSLHTFKCIDKIIALLLHIKVDLNRFGKKGGKITIHVDKWEGGGGVHHTCAKSEFHNTPILLLFFYPIIFFSNSHTGQQIDIPLLMPTIIFGPQKVGVLKGV